MASKKTDQPPLPTPPVVAEPSATFIVDVRTIHRQARSKACAATNVIMVDAYWQVLMRVENPSTCSYYIREAADRGWKTRRLPRLESIVIP
ncbi:MAG: hypothetical protein HQM09_25135 [Candidatus Riflebacteria bacterium]|nr:hypothetical protein [Candidatus Riflebacteria bacterium]